MLKSFHKKMIRRSVPKLTAMGITPIQMTFGGAVYHNGAQIANNSLWEFSPIFFYFLIPLGF